MNKEQLKNKLMFLLSCYKTEDWENARKTEKEIGVITGYEICSDSYYAEDSIHFAIMMLELLD